MNQYMPSDNPSFDDMLHAGRVALQAGKPDLAHDIWREAAKIQPYDERIWLALLEVLSKDEDQLVCLRNIIAINPMNVQAQRQLNAIEARADRQAEQEAEEVIRQTQWRERRQWLFWRSVLLGLAVGLSALFFAIVVIILQSTR